MKLGDKRWVALGTLAALLWALIFWRALAPPVRYPISAWSLEDMVFVPAGRPVRFGRPLGPIEAFWIDRTEVTEGAYAEFIAAHPTLAIPRHWDARTRRPPAGTEELPVIWVSANDARRYAAWQRKRLPTAVEWDWAARADRRFPWGGATALSLVANLDGISHVGRTPVGLFEGGRSPAGAYDMVGNVREWTETRLLGLVDERVVVLGGSFRDSRRGVSEAIWLAEGHLVRPASPGAVVPDLDAELAGREAPPRTLLHGLGAMADDIGFRCAMNDQTVQELRRTADRVARLVQDLGARDPLGIVFEKLPARRRLSELGELALPGLKRALWDVEALDLKLADEIRSVIAQIEREARSAR